MKTQAKEKLGKDEPKTFDEFADAAMRDLHDRLLSGGSKEMKGGLYVWLPYFTRWLAKDHS